MSTRNRPRIAIIGSGFSGLGLAIWLRAANIHSFTILEKSHRVGGTWRDNTYPGAACDIPSFAYCFSFEQKRDWSRKWAPQAEILAYIDHCVEAHDLAPHIRLGAEVASARYLEREGAWRLTTTGGESIEAEILVSGVGQLSRPFIPDIPGLDRFAGAAFHSARWNHDLDLAGKRVGVVGNAASAIQLIPEIAPLVARLHVFQRSANWMLPKGDRAFTRRELAAFARFPALARLYRRWLWLEHELRYPALQHSRFLRAKITGMALDHLRSRVNDPELRDVLTPDYPMGAKRVLLSDDYYETLQRPNVEVIPGDIERVTSDAVVQGDRTYPVDALIFATGFQTTSFLAPIEITGRGGASLGEAWRDGAEAYLGIAVAGFPNFFIMYGPNTNLGHNSLLFMLECQAGYIVDCIQQIIRGRLKSIEVRREVMTAYNRRLQDRLARSVWAEVERSWYMTESGKITTNWPESTLSYWWKTRRADLGVYRREAPP